MAAIRKIKRAGKKATKFHYSTTYQSILIECHTEQWTPHMIQVAWHRHGRRIVSQILPWLPSPDTPLRGMVVWPEPELVETSITLYKGPKDKSYEHKDWDFSVIDVDKNGQRKVLATSSVDMVKYASALPYEHELQLKLKPVSRKIKKILLELSISSVFLKEGKATDDDMISLASMMSVSNLSMIGNLEDEDDDFIMKRFNGRSISPEIINAAVPSTDKLIDWAQEVTTGYSGVKIINMTTSWRNGLAFCAIIHYYRPDLLEFHQLSPQSIKENNRMAFNISQELGIACPLTPDMMLLRDIPDKLAVTAFVYQMYNYFTMAVPSAIIKSTGSATKEEHAKTVPTPLEGLKSFDFSEIEKLTCKNLSPTTKGEPASQRNLTGNKWSKHSLREEQEQQQQQNDQSSCSNEGMVHTPEKNESISASDQPLTHSTPLSAIPDVTSTSVVSLSNDTSSSSSVDTRSEKMEMNSTCGHPSPLTAASRSDLSLPLSSVSVNSVNSKNSPVGTPTKVISDDSCMSHTNSITSSPVEQKKEYYRKQAKEMMAKAGVRGDTASIDSFTYKTRKRIQEARKNSQSSHVLRSVESSPLLPIKTIGSSAKDKEKEDLKSNYMQSSLQSDANATDPRVSKSETNVESHVSRSQTNEDSNRIEDSNISKLTNSTNYSDVNDDTTTVAIPSKEKQQHKRLRTPRKNKSTTDLEKNSKNHLSSSLVILAPEPRRSTAAMKMAEEPPKQETEETDKPNKQEEGEEKEDGGLVMARSRNSSMTSSTESPCAWTSHNDDLAEAILVSTSDYIKNELRLIQKDLKPLEERATFVENEIREAMGIGDGFKEEKLTVEYFKLLNEKNVLVKKQIELNLLEKEEDLQKRQFFINRELRPLAAIPEEQKTDQQKAREKQLIEELLEIMNEREWLDQRLTRTTSTSAVESSTVFVSPDESSDVSHTSSFSTSIKSKFTRNHSISSQKAGEKDCVIS